jgi:hypothetical protein
VSGQLLPLLCLLASAEAPPPPQDVQRDGVAAIWFAPTLSRGAMAPVAGQVGVQLGPHAMLTGSYGEFPNQYVRVSEWTVGARWFLSKAALAPFLAAEYGKMTQEIDDTGGREDAYAFGSIGGGLEKVWVHHVSFSTDLQLGPGHRADGSYHDPTWLLWMQYRIAVGLRF